MTVNVRLSIVLYDIICHRVNGRILSPPVLIPVNLAALRRAKPNYWVYEARVHLWLYSQRSKKLAAPLPNALSHAHRIPVAQEQVQHRPQLPLWTPQYSFKRQVHCQVCHRKVSVFESVTNLFESIDIILL